MCRFRQGIHREQGVLDRSRSGLRGLSDREPGCPNGRSSSRALPDRPIHRACASDRKLQPIPVLEVKAAQLLVVLGPILFEDIANWQKYFCTAGIDMELRL